MEKIIVDIVALTCALPEKLKPNKQFNCELNIKHIAGYKSKACERS